MRRTALLAAVLATLTACTSSEPGAAPSPSLSPSATATTTSPTPSPSAPVSLTPSPTPSACSTQYAAPDPRRPVVTLDVTVAPGHDRVTGRETVLFRPDRTVTELVFRLWPNGPRSARAGGSLTVTKVQAQDGGARFTVESGGTLLRIPLPAAVPAGGAVRATLDFTLVLPSGASERYGHRGGTAWFASGFPLLAWERGRGWATEPATAAFAEATTSEVFRMERLDVTVPDGDVVLGTGAPVRVAAGRYRATADAVRDVMVAVSRFRMANATGPGGVPIRVGVPPGMSEDAAQVARLNATAMRVHANRFGPFPYPSLDVAMVPDVRGGIEYPGGILLGAGQLDATLTHEVAHEWFYGLVGDNQARDPWLDEAFATYAEALHRGTGPNYQNTPIPAYGLRRVGRPMTYWERNSSTYFRSVYVQGAATLLRARAAVGAARWDQAIRCYVARNAHRIATPKSLEDALAGLPAAVSILRRYGALPPG